MTSLPDEVARGLAALRRRLDARAAGAWRVEPAGDRLVQLAFVSSPAMDVSVASGFAEATRSVPLARREFGIVAAAADRRRRVMVAADLPPDAGSGGWLRTFDAERSVAVPISNEAGVVLGVISVALVGRDLDDDAVEATLREAASNWFLPG